tara:strand:+ start:7730 stop:7939 length:210 start_codon:yes stop_codon:yes gene_type:complete
MLCIDNLRKGYTYQITNHREQITFEVIDFTENDYLVKNTTTLEVFNLKEIIQYGLGNDYELIDLEGNEK